MKKILFPTDFSAVADHAFVYALKLADQIGASITTVHSYELPIIKNSHLPVTMREVYESISLEEFENYRDHVPHLHKIAEKAGLDQLEIEHVMLEGEAVYNIIRQAHKEDYELIVMGTTGASGLKKIFLGSVAAEVMENAPCPVLAIPGKANFDGVIDKVAFATSYKEDEVGALRWLAKSHLFEDAQIYCVHIDLQHTEDLSHQMARFRERFADLEGKVSFEVVDHTDFSKAISEYINETGIDLLAMVIHKRNYFKEWFGYSYTKSLAYHSSSPIMAIPEKAIANLAGRVSS